jgi:hypothetical protein
MNRMANQLKLYEGQPTTSETTLYTTPAGREVNLTEVIAVNTSGTAAVFSLSIVPSGGTAGATNRVLAGQSIAANTEQRFQFDEELSAGDFLSGIQTTGGAVTLTIGGNPITPS